MLSIVAARWLLIVHAILGVATVGAATHWVIWLWPWRRGAYRRPRATKRFGVITMVIYVAAMVAGGVLYPTYKARIKLEYLTRAEVVIADQTGRLMASETVAARWDTRAPATLPPSAVQAATSDAVSRAGKIARWFDVKEHWVAVGLVLGLATMAVLLAWSPREDDRGPLVFVFVGALATAAVVWLAAIIGLVVAATRSF